MKGVVFNLLERVVSEKYGEEAWDTLLEATGQEGAYTAVGSYPDEEFLSLVGAASTELEIPADDLVRWFGKSSLPLLRERYPTFFGHDSTRSFILTLNDVIHPEVRKLFPGADVPDFDFESPGDGKLVLGYRSARKLCSFAEGLIEGAAEFFGEEVRMEQPQCMKRGDEKCLIVCSFKKIAMEEVGP
jgi:Haem-NO-binding